MTFIYVSFNKIFKRKLNGLTILRSVGSLNFARSIFLKRNLIGLP
jgi:hypothetical protein